MVKKPPCKEYEPPKNIMYKRGDKMFCRKKRNNSNFIYNQVNNNSGPEFVFTTKVDKKYIEVAQYFEDKEVHPVFFLGPTEKDLRSIRDYKRKVFTS